VGGTDNLPVRLAGMVDRLLESTTADIVQCVDDAGRQNQADYCQHAHEDHDQHVVWLLGPANGHDYTSVDELCNNDR